MMIRKGRTLTFLFDICLHSIFYVKSSIRDDKVLPSCVKDLLNNVIGMKIEGVDRVCFSRLLNMLKVRQWS